MASLSIDQILNNAANVLSNILITNKNQGRIYEEFEHYRILDQYYTDLTYLEVKEYYDRINSDPLTKKVSGWTMNRFENDALAKALVWYLYDRLIHSRTENYQNNIYGIKWMTNKECSIVVSNIYTGLPYYYILRNNLTQFYPLSEDVKEKIDGGYFN